MSISLIRNARVFFTTNVDSVTGVVNTASGFTSANTREIQVLDGFSFSQNTTSETVTLNEAGATPVRGQRSFNTALEPVDFSFSTYIRPHVNIAATLHTLYAEESVLWGAMYSNDGTAWVGAAGAANTEVKSSVSVAASDVHQLQKFGLIINIDDASYIIDNCVLDSATIDFGIDAIGTIAWAGKGAKLRSDVVVVPGTTVTGTWPSSTVSVSVAGSPYTVKAKDTSAAYLANKLSVAEVTFTDFAGTPKYSIPLTGGSITFANNVTYLTPANLGVVNQPITYFTGTRAITCTLNAYLRTGASGAPYDTGKLLTDMLTDSQTNVDPKFKVSIILGGAADDTTNYRVGLKLPTAVLQIPTIATEQVISTTINVTAQSSTAGASTDAFDITKANEVTVLYAEPAYDLSTDLA